MPVPRSDPLDSNEVVSPDDTKKKEAGAADPKDTAAKAAGCCCSIQSCKDYFRKPVLSVRPKITSHHLLAFCFVLHRSVVTHPNFPIADSREAFLASGALRLLLGQLDGTGRVPGHWQQRKRPLLHDFASRIAGMGLA